jgi:hypothetical protein
LDSEIELLDRDWRDESTGESGHGRLRTCRPHSFARAASARRIRFASDPLMTVVGNNRYYSANDPRRNSGLAAGY